ncbi:MAG: hypothetical protein KAK04_00050 [Cyclobacteriaceae bacterium]|nr:hypothetical protein [Cyclobacteriaceae bacterium]
MVKVAIPVTGDLLSENFKDCSYYVIYEIDNKEVVNKKKEVPPKKLRNELSKWTETSGITDVIVHGIDNPSVNYFSTTKINLFVGVTINEPEQLIEEYLKGTLQSDAQRIFDQ